MGIRSQQSKDLDERAALFAAQHASKVEDWGRLQLAFKAGFVDSQRLKDRLSPYRGLIGVFRRIWTTWHKARFDSLEELYLLVYRDEMQAQKKYDKKDEG